MVSNEFTLPAGTYRTRISCPCFEVSSTNARLYNVTDAAVVPNTESNGSFGDASGGGDHNWGEPLIIVAQFTLTSSKLLRVEHQCLVTKASIGFGTAPAVDVAVSQKEVFTVVELFRTD